MYTIDIFARIQLEEIAEQVSNLNSVDDIVNFVIACIPDKEVADEVMVELRKKWTDIYVDDISQNTTTANYMHNSKSKGEI